VSVRLPFGRLRNRADSELVELHAEVLSNCTQHFALKLRVLSAMPTKLPKNPDTCE